MTPFFPNQTIHFIYLLRISHNFNESLIFIYLFKSFEFFIFLFFYFPIKMINWRHIKDDIEKNMFLEENNIEENNIEEHENINEDINILEENENLIEENENLIEENKNLMLEIERLQNDKFEKIVLIVVSIIFTFIVILKTN